MCARLGLDKLECRTDSVCCRVCRSAEQAVCLAHLNEHCSKIVSFEECCSAFVGCHFALAQLDHSLDHLFHSVVVLRIDDLGFADIKATFFSCSLDCVNISYKHYSHEILCKESCGSFLDTGICTLSKYNCLRLSLDFFNQFVKHFDISIVY